MTEREAQRAVRPLASGVRVLHPLRGTEDEPRLTAEQRTHMEEMRAQFDSLAFADDQPGDGRVWLVGWRGSTQVHVELSRDGIPT